MMCTCTCTNYNVQIAVCLSLYSVYCIYWCTCVYYVHVFSLRESRRNNPPLQTNKHVHDIIHMYMYIHVYITIIYMHMYMYMYTCMCTCVYMYVHMCIHCVFL